MPLSFWSDESKFELFGQKRWSRVWRKPGEALKEVNIQKYVKHGSGNIMVWDALPGLVIWLKLKVLWRQKDVLIMREFESLLKLDLENNFIF